MIKFTVYYRGNLEWDRWAFWRRNEAEGGIHMLFLGQFLQYVIIMLILAAIGVAGIFAGKKLRQNKDAKQALNSHEEK